LFDIVGVDAGGRLVEVGLEALFQGLIDQGVPVGDKEDMAGLVGAQKQVYQRHGDTGLAGAGGHDDEGAALACGKGFGHLADGLLLVEAVGDGGIEA
jgi:hypothetical protein